MGKALEENKKQYIIEYYRPEYATFPGIEIYNDICGWTDYYIGNSALFSRRSVFYDSTTFPDKLHTHGFFEIVIFLGGNVSYVSGDSVFTPGYGDIMIFPPDCEHTVRSSKDGVYDRAVLYIEREWFVSNAMGYFPEVFRRDDACCYMIAPGHSEKFMSLLAKLEQLVSAMEEDTILTSSGYLSLILATIGKHAVPNYDSMFRIPQKLAEIKEYIDLYYDSITKVDELSSKFYYSREHICRLFKDYFKITPSEYLHRKKIERARQALDVNRSARYAFDVSGFQSYSSFVKAFKEIVGVTPSKYSMVSGSKHIPQTVQENAAAPTQTRL